MPGSAESRLNLGARAKRAAGLFPIPRTMGSFAILITALAFLAGQIRNELALTLLGTVFSCILSYSFLGAFLLGLVHRRKALSLSIAIASETVNVQSHGELLIKADRHFWRLPAILVRCEICLKTRDGRVIRHCADPALSQAALPGAGNYSRFPVSERGAYYGEHDRFIVFDAPGFFRLSIPIPQGAGPRLFAVPVAAEDSIPLSLKAGGSRQRNEPHYRKSDELTDHRPYIPGDDPRRINWKLYGHAPMGELFVREGEPEPPPHSRLLILIDTETDSALYTLDEGRRAVDLLCESALAAALEFSSQGMDISIGCTGDQKTSAKIIGGEGNAVLNAAELAAALAWPAAIRASPKAHLPRAYLPQAYLPTAPKDRSVLILALPRTLAADLSAADKSSALDKFIKKRKAGTDIVFIYDALASDLEDAAKACVKRYRGMLGNAVSNASCDAYGIAEGIPAGREAQ